MPSFVAPENIAIPPVDETETREQNGATAPVTPRSPQWAAEEVLVEGKMHKKHKALSTSAVLLLAWQSLGVVYGDLGTSCLYVYSNTFHSPPSHQDLLGAACIIFWTLTSIALVKYVMIVLHADDDGEGGTFAMYSLLCRHARISLLETAKLNVTAKPRLTRAQSSKVSARGVVRGLLEGNKSLQKALMVFVLMGTCMVIGDGILTPAISVLSAVEGIHVGYSGLSRSAIVGITCAILIALFLCQHKGTGRVGNWFAPVIGIWLVANLCINLYNISKHHPGMFRCINPWHGLDYFIRNGKTAWVSLGGLVLCITGTEAMFADLGHFPRQAIQMGFLLIGYPSLVITYIGQAAYLWQHPENYASTFYSSVPGPIFWPMFVLATLATIVASQAMISGAFSIIKQSMSLSCFPKVRIIHTSKTMEGQIYIPEINYVFMVLTIAVVVGFQDSTQIGNAYGVSVMSVMLITTFLMSLVMLMVWRLPPWLPALFFAVFGFIEAIYLSSTLYKIANGAWFPVLLSGLLLVIMYAWYYGSSRKSLFDQKNMVNAQGLTEFLANMPVTRVPGVGLFYSDTAHGVPPVFTHFITHLPAVPEVLIFMNIRHEPVPRLEDEDRLLVKPFGIKGYYRCVVRYGYQESVRQGEEFTTQLLNKIIEVTRFELGDSGPVDASPESPRLEASLSSSPLVSSAPVKLAPGKSFIAGPRERAQVEEDLALLEQARSGGIVYVLGRSVIHVSPSAWVGKRWTLYLYAGLKAISRSTTQNYQIPHSKLIEVGMIYDV
ncbi:Potassium transporter family protein [Klebsormidium nitens]|uniref:Potassium transporter n=1 Tax=Klebsormidium nitens TaxID=105231 RepID=A0A1Y1I436_KLENI|nr:Potassium transporter family protein [Klebsormidium nitens]|eukprot:GAQ83496.1 Potassium transporter family protein [Klebsormidium nitens]